jgi:hypothetical protein
MPRCAAPIRLTTEERAALEQLIRAGSTPQQTALRARMIVMAAGGAGVAETAQALGVWRKGVSRQRSRWLAVPTAAVIERLGDAPLSGAPATFSAEQTCGIVAMACEAPEESGLPLSHWSASDLAREAVRRGIVPAISPRTVGRFLKRIGPQAASRPAVADTGARP